MDIQKRAVSYFEHHKGVDTFHFTSDGMAFKQKTHAESHAANLKDAEIQTVKRKEVAKVKPAAGQSEAEKLAAAEAAAAKAAEAKNKRAALIEAAQKLGYDGPLNAKNAAFEEFIEKNKAPEDSADEE